MSSPTRRSNDSYARGILERKKKLDHVPLFERLARDIEILAESLMVPAVLERRTHLLNARSYLSAGNLCISGSTCDAFEQPDLIQARISFYENKKSFAISLATLMLMGRTRFCLRMARKLRDALARREAQVISRWGLLLPDGALGGSGSAYANALLAAKAKLDKQHKEPRHESLAARIMLLCKQRMGSALDAGLTHLAIRYTKYQDGLITVDAHCADGAIANPYALRCSITLQPYRSKTRSFLIMAFAMLVGRERFCSLAAQRLCSTLAHLEAQALHERGAGLPAGILARHERDALGESTHGSSLAKPSTRL